eukprot:4622175-Prymnesium_polylepis.1
MRHERSAKPKYRFSRLVALEQSGVQPSKPIDSSEAEAFLGVWPPADQATQAEELAAMKLIEKVAAEAFQDAEAASEVMSKMDPTAGIARGSIARGIDVLPSSAAATAPPVDARPVQSAATCDNVQMASCSTDSGFNRSVRDEADSLAAASQSAHSSSLAGTRDPADGFANDHSDEMSKLSGIEETEEQMHAATKLQAARRGSMDRRQLVDRFAHDTRRQEARSGGHNHDTRGAVAKATHNQSTSHSGVHITPRHANTHHKVPANEAVHRTHGVHANKGSGDRHLHGTHDNSSGACTSQNAHAAGASHGKYSSHGAGNNNGKRKVHPHENTQHQHHAQGAGQAPS